MALLDCTAPTALNLVWSLLLTLVVLYFFVILIVSHKQIWKRSSRASIILNYAFYLTILLCAMLWMASYAIRIIDCDDSALSSTGALLESLGSLCYVTQYILLLILLFRRLCSVFDATAHAVSSRIIYTFYGTLVALLVFALGGVLVPNEGVLKTVATVFDILGNLGCIVLISMIVGTFIQKLRAVRYESDTDASPKPVGFEGIIIKNFLLTLLSILSLLIMLTYIIIGSGLPDEYFEDYRLIGGQLMVGFDLLSNFVSVLFGFAYFEKYYLLLCRCCDRKLMTSYNARRDNESTLNIGITVVTPSVAQVSSVSIGRTASASPTPSIGSVESTSNIHSA